MLLSDEARVWLADVDHVLLDVDGVVCVGDAPCPRAGEVVTALRAHAPVVVVTNDSRRGPVEQRARLRRAGVADDVPVVTAVDAVVARLRAAGGSRVEAVGTPGLVATLHDRGVEVVPRGGDAVVVGCLVDPGALDPAVVRPDDDRPWLATNADAVVPTPTGTLPDTGAVLAALARAGRGDVEVCGKPSPWMTAAVRVVHPVGRALVVGDGEHTDLAWARAEGWPAVHVLPGSTAPLAVADLAGLLAAG